MMPDWSRWASRKASVWPSASTRGSTARKRFSRSKLEMKTAASAMPSESRMSPRTRSVAVAVTARQTAPGEAPPHGRQLAILRPEVVAPLRNAVGLVDGQAVDAAAVEQGQRLRPYQRLRRGVEQLDLARGHAATDGHVLVVGQGAVEVGRGHAQLAQLHHLVFHQRDERRDDHGQAGEESSAGNW
jgi:hypothetical protein